MADAKARAGRLVHLREDHHHVGQHTGGLHLAVQFLAFARSFADAAEDTHTLLVADHVVDHLGQQHRLADAGAPEQARLAAALQRREHVDGLDTGLEDLGLRRAAHQRWWQTVHRAPCHTHLAGQRRPAVDGVAEDVEHARQDGPAHRRLQWPAGVLHGHAARQALSGCERDAPHVPRIALGQHLDGDTAAVIGAQQGMNGRQRAVEPHVHDAAADRDDDAGQLDFGFSVHSDWPWFNRQHAGTLRCGLQRNRHATCSRIGMATRTQSWGGPAVCSARLN